MVSFINIIDINPTKRATKIVPATVDPIKRSIQATGLFNPLLVENDARTLICGYGRYLALLGMGGNVYRYLGEFMSSSIVPFLTLGDLAAEMKGGFGKGDLTWQQTVAIISDLHLLRKRQFENWRLKDTAGMIFGGEPTGHRLDQIQKAVIVFAHLGKPEVDGCGSLKEAFNMIEFGPLGAAQPQAGQ